MRVLVALLGFAALLATGAWTAALPPPAIAEGTLAPVDRRRRGVPQGPRSIPSGQHVLLRAPPRRIVSVALSGDEILLELVPPERLAGLTYLIDDPDDDAEPRACACVRGPRHRREPRGAACPSPGPRRQRGLHARRGHRDPRGRGRAGHRYRRPREPRRRSCRGHGAGRGRRGAGAGAGARGVAASAHRVGRVASRHAQHRPRILVWEGGYTYGRGTMADDIVRRAGGIDVASEAGIDGPVAMTEEAAVALAPELVLVPIEDSTPRWHDPIARRRCADLARRRRRSAAAEVYGVPRAWLGSVSHHAVRALEAVAAILDARRSVMRPGVPFALLGALGAAAMVIGGLRGRRARAAVARARALLALARRRGLGVARRPARASAAGHRRLPRRRRARRERWSPPGLFRNPLAEPGVLGVSNGAALGAVIAIFSGLDRPRSCGPPDRGLRSAPCSSPAALLAIGSARRPHERGLAAARRRRARQPGRGGDDAHHLAGARQLRRRSPGPSVAARRARGADVGAGGDGDGAHPRRARGRPRRCAQARRDAAGRRRRGGRRRRRRRGCDGDSSSRLPC